MPDELRTETEIPVANLSTVQKAIAKLNKRAEKLGVDPVQLTVLSRRFKRLPPTPDEAEYAAATGSPAAARKIEVVEILVEGQAPKLAGWTFVGTIEHGEDGNILRSIPDAGTLPTEYRTSGPSCDHCRLDRRRNDTYVVHHDDGDFKRVGRNCLRDFLGHRDPHAIAAFAKHILDLVCMVDEMSDLDSWGGGGGRDEFFDLVDVLAVAATVIRRDGWVSRKVAMEHEGMTATASTVNFILSPHPRENDRTKAERREYTDDFRDTDRGMAEAALSWAQDISIDTQNDYLWNLRTLAQNEAIGYRGMGLAVSMVSAHQRELGNEIIRRKQAAESNHFGEVKVRGTFTLTVTALRGYESDWGDGLMVGFVDSDGNRAKWFTSAHGESDFEIGQELTIKATVKKHSEYKGVKETLLTRCKVIESTPTLPLEAVN